MRRHRERVSFVSGLLVALGLSLSGGAVLAVLAPLVGAEVGVKVVTAVLGLAYVSYTIGRSRERVGRVTTLVVWLSAALAVWLAGTTLVPYVLVHLGLVWLVRSLYRYSGVLPALVDAGLIALGTAFAAWAAARSESTALALWCFFLVQAFHVAIPATLSRRGAGSVADDEDGFDRARRAAEAALRRLAESR